MFNINRFKLTDKVAIITGGASGLGEYYTRAMLTVGAKVMVVSHSERGWDKIKAVAAELGGQVAFFAQNVTAEDAPQKIVNATLDQYGRIDILVNNAGRQIRHPWDEFPKEDWQKVLDLNLNSVYYLSQEVAKVMKRQGGGKIINIGSMQS